jgi:hypothetical protein
VQNDLLECKFGCFGWKVSKQKSETQNIFRKISTFMTRVNQYLKKGEGSKSKQSKAND